MKSSIIIAVPRYDIVPKEGRVEWLEKWGVIAETIRITATAELADWAKVATVRADGGIDYPDSHGAETAIRAAIALRLRNDPSDTTEFDATAVIREVAEAKESKAVEQAAKKAEEARIFAAIEALSSDDIFDEDGTYRIAHLFGTTDPPLHRAICDGLSDCGIARWECRNLRTEMLRRCAAKKERNIAENEAKKAQLASDLAAWVASTSGIFEPHVVRAASEGRDVKQSVRLEIAHRVYNRLVNCGAPPEHRVLESDEYWNPEVDRRAPTAIAYQVRDNLIVARPELITAIPGVAVEVTDFARIDVNSSRKVYRTAVEVKIYHPWIGHLNWAVLTEPLDDGDKCDDDDSDNAD